MLFPTKMRNSMANAIEQVVNLNRSSRRFSSAGSVSGRSVSSSKNFLAPPPVAVPAVIDEHNIYEDDISTVGNDASEDEDMLSLQESVGAGRGATSVDSVREDSTRNACVDNTNSSASNPELKRNADEEAEGVHGNQDLQEEEPLTNGSHILDSNEMSVDGSGTPSEELSLMSELERERELLDNVKAGMDNLINTVLPEIPPNLLYDRPISLKTAALAVRFLLRLRKGLVTKDYSIMGSYGLKLYVKSLQKSMELTSIEEMTEVKGLLASAEDRVQELEGRLTCMESESKAQTEAHAKAISELEGKLQAVKTEAIRERMIGRIQRCHAEFLATHMSVFRARLHLMTHVNMIRDEVPKGMINPPERKKANVVPPTHSGSPMKPKKRTSMMSFGSKAYVADKKKKEMDLMSDEEEENDVTRKPLYKARKVFFHVLGRLRSLKFDRPFRRANSKLLSSKHGKAISAWMHREEEILQSFVKDAQYELSEVERILNRMRTQCSEDRRKAECFKALLGN